MKVVDRGTPYTGRISVNSTTDEVVLIISNVQPHDELEFICLVKGLTDGVAEGRSKLKVFGKIQSEMACVFWLSNKGETGTLQNPHIEDIANNTGFKINNR